VARSARFDAGWAGDGVEAILAAMSGQRSVPMGQMRELGNRAVPATIPVVFALNRNAAPGPFVQTPVGSSGHCVSYDGHSVMTTGQRVDSGGHFVSVTGHWVSVGGQCVSEPG
jgi:hypothetical protein